MVLQDESIEPIRGVPELAKQVFLVGCAVLFYFGVRGLTEGSEAAAIANGEWILAREGDLGVDVERTVQGWTVGSHWVTTLANWVYIWLHWPVLIGTLLWLHHTRIARYLLLRNAIFLSGAVGLVIFATFPVAPPRLLDAGFVDTVTAYANSYRVLQPPSLVNKFAAMPSLHVGWNLLVGIALFQSSRNTAIRVFAVVAPLLMAIAVVATGNHYVVDGAVGTVVALVGAGLASLITRPLLHLDYRIRHWNEPGFRRERRRSAAPPVEADELGECRSEDPT